MKLLVQIPCFNEQESVSEVLQSIPKNISRIDEIEILVIDDGSEDNTSKIAQDFGAKVIKLNKNYGLSHAFKIGLNYAISNKIDILVNIDGDNQYCALDIEKLIQPILDNKCDITIGARPINEIETFSPFKKLMQKFGSFIVKIISNVDIKDASSGFRAYSRKAFLKINIFNNFTYTIESIIQAKSKDLKMQNVDIKVNLQKNRKSKLFKNDFIYIFKQAKNLIRFFIIYRPARFFSFVATIFLLVGFLIGLRFLYFYIFHNGSGHIQSLILCSIILFLSFISYMLAIVGDLFSINRKLLEDIQYMLKNKN